MIKREAVFYDQLQKWNELTKMTKANTANCVQGVAFSSQSELVADGLKRYTGCFKYIGVTNFIPANESMYNGSYIGSLTANHKLNELCLSTSAKNLYDIAKLAKETHEKVYITYEEQDDTGEIIEVENFMCGKTIVPLYTSEDNLRFFSMLDTLHQYNYNSLVEITDDEDLKRILGMNADRGGAFLSINSDMVFVTPTILPANKGCRIYYYSISSSDPRDQNDENTINVNHFIVMYKKYSVNVLFKTISLK